MSSNPRVMPVIRTTRSEVGAMAKLTAKQVRQVRLMKKQNTPQTVIAERMKMSTAAVSFLLNKKTYRGVK